MARFCCVIDPDAPMDALLDLARACSPRVAPRGAHAVVFDVSGLDRVIGPPPMIAGEIARLAAARELHARVAIAGTMTAAWLLASHGAGTAIVAPGEEAASIAPLPLEILDIASADPRVPLARVPSADSRVPDLLAVLSRWGLRTLGDLARLPEADIRTRLGEPGVRLHRMARGTDDVPLVPQGDARRFVERLELEWPIEGLEPLSFVLARLCDGLSAALEQADRGAVAIATRLRLTNRTAHLRTLALPAPMRDSRVLRTLILLDLESHPPAAAIDIVEVEVDVMPGQIVQGSLLARALPAAGQIATLIARLRALMGESRVGVPALVDTYDDRAVAMGEFSPGPRPQAQGPSDHAADVLGPEAVGLGPLFRRLPLPIAVAVDLERGAPAQVRPSARGLAGGRVLECAGPWRSSGRWWALDGTPWDRESWHVALPDGIYRLARDRTTGRWEIDGTVD